LTSILAFIVAHMGYLWAGAKFQITGSRVGTSNGGDALLVVESDVLRLQFTRDKGQLWLAFQPILTRAAHEWFSVDLMRSLLLGRLETTGLLDESYAEFLNEHMAAIEERFAEEQWPTTRAELRVLKEQRAKRLFG